MMLPAILLASEDTFFLAGGLADRRDPDSRQYEDFDNYVDRK